MLDTLRQELALEVTALALDHMVARLSTLFELYEAALEQAAGRLLFRDVKAARDRGHGFMLEIVAHIVGRFYRQDDANHEQARTELLEPLWQQDQAMREYLRARRLRGAADGAELDGDIDIDIEADSADATAGLAVPAAIPPALAPAPPTAPALAPPTAPAPAPAPAPAATVDVDDRARAMTASDRLTD
jgi:hypothetical protein